MLERRSALAKARPYRSPVLTMGEVLDFSLFLVAGDDAAVAAAGPLPDRIGLALESDGRTVMRVGPRQFWFVGPEDGELPAKFTSTCAVTPLSHSRSRIFLDGPPARDVLAKGIPLDFHDSVFTPGTFAMTGLHHTPVTVHCISGNRFEIYSLRTYAMSVWGWLADAGLEFAG